MKMDLGRLVRFNEQRAGDPELAIAHERGWRAYHAIKDFIYSERCRRRSLLDHFGDRTAGAPLERCCDVCDARELAAGPGDDRGPPAQRRGGGSAPAPDLSPADAPLFEALKAWRLSAAAGKPAYTVANNRTLAAIAAVRPTERGALIEISGVGPGFISKFAPEVLAIVAEHARPRSPPERAEPRQLRLPPARAPNAERRIANHSPWLARGPSAADGGSLAEHTHLFACCEGHGRTQYEEVADDPWTQGPGRGMRLAALGPAGARLRGDRRRRPARTARQEGLVRASPTPATRPTSASSRPRSTSTRR